MGSLIFITVAIVLSVIFYLNDNKKHAKLIVKTRYKLHFNNYVSIKYRINDIKYKYPVLYRVTNSFLEATEMLTLEEMFQNSKTLDNKDNNILLDEITNVLEKEDDKIVEILKWYLVTCILINMYKELTENNNVVTVERKIIDLDKKDNMQLEKGLAVC